MFQNPLDSFTKKPKDSFLIPNQTVIAKKNAAQYLIFYVLHCIIDLIVLIQYAEHLKFTIPKLGTDLIFTSLLLFFPQKVNNLHLNIFLLLTKITSILLIALIGKDLVLILVFICEQNDVPLQNTQKLEYLVQRIVMKISGLVVIIVQYGLFDIISLLFVLLFEMYRVVLYYKENNKTVLNDEGLVNLHSLSPKDNKSVIMKESNGMNKFQTMPICIITFSTQDLKLCFINQICSQYFHRFCETNEELEEMILNKLSFQIVQQKVCDQKNIGTQQHISRSRFKYKEEFKDSQTDSINLVSQGAHSLKSILRLYLQGKLADNINCLTHSLELYCQHNWDQDTISVYTAQLSMNHEEGEIIFILIDISQQYQFQEELITDQFKTQIVQSFSHELRTPLNSACNFLSCCLNHRNILDEIKQNFIQPAYDVLRLQSYLINDIIDFNTLYAEEIELVNREFNVKDLIDEINSLFKSSIEMKQLALYIDLFENSVNTITTDFSRLIQIIVNILQNSIKNSNSDSGIIILKLTSFSQNYIKFTIKDEGSGINEERLVQINQMLLDIENKRDFAKYKTWHGFGLLISSMLLSKLCPPDYKSLLIRSGGNQKGTKVAFYIENRNSSVSNFSSSGYYGQNTIRWNSKAKVSLQSVLRQVSINGTLIQISDLGVSNRKLNTQFLKKVTIKSIENSIFTDSCLNNDVDQKMGELIHVQPTLITDIAIQPKRNRYDLYEHHSHKSPREQSKVLSYKRIKLQNDQDSENLLKTFIKKKKCTCQRILSVDDEIFNQRSIQFLLQQQGFQTVLAFNGEEALAIVNQIERCSPTCNLFMLILMDYQMPIMDGIATTQALRSLMEQHTIPQIHIIGLTAFNSKRDIQNCLEAGMSDVLTKPLNMKEFFEILNVL